MTSASDGGDRAGRLPVAAVIPAHNEEKTIGDVVRTLVTSGFFDEVIVVSDRSDDRTADEARTAGATLVHELPRRLGKGGALGHGVMHTDLPVVCFFDADLKGLTADHVARLVTPVAHGRRYMNVGLRDRGRFLTALSSRLPLISGERALRREIFDMIPDKYRSGYKVEIALGYYCRVNSLPFGPVPLPGLRIVRKMQKVGFIKGFAGYLTMSAEVAWAMLQVRIARRRFVQRGTHMSHRHGRSPDVREW